MRITDVISQYIEGGLDLHGMGEAIDYDCSVVPMPTQQGMMPVILMTLVMPSTILGRKIIGSSMIASVHPEERQIHAAVGDLLEQLRTQRSSEVASATNGNPAHMPPGGPPAAPGGPLILPGQ